LTHKAESSIVRVIKRKLLSSHGNLKKMPALFRSMPQNPGKAAGEEIVENEVQVFSSIEEERGDEAFLFALGTGSIGRSKTCSMILDLKLFGGEYHDRG
jgi:hypothetical protein